MSVCVPAALDQYEKVNPVVLPVVTDDAVRSTVAGEHTAAGLVILTVGRGFTVTTTRVSTAVDLPGHGTKSHGASVGGS